MAFSRGKIYLANFNPAKGDEPGKVRPCLMVQSDDLNDASHPTSIVLPLTTQVRDAAPLRIRVTARQSLRQDSDVMVDQIRTIDNTRLIGTEIGALTDAEMIKVEAYLSLVLAVR